MKKKMIALMAVGILLTGCSALSETGGGDEAAGASGTETASEPVGEEPSQGGSGAGNKDGSAGAYEVEAPQEKQYTWQEYTVTLPDGWVGRCVMEENEAGFSIYQKASYEKDEATGYICGFFRTQEPVEYDHGKVLVAYTEDGMLYYMAQPTDVACDTEDEEIAGEYVRMCQQVPQLKASLQIAGSGVHGNADEYMLPTSSILLLDPAELAGWSDNSLWIARNEIYARHGRQFANAYLQHYFDRCTWYEGEIPPQEFSESVLNQVEKDNLQLLAAAEAEYDRQHPYPKPYQASETATEDLNGDGAADRIGYRAAEQGNGEIFCTLTVNGEAYIANELADAVSDIKMTNPTLDGFYITDIQESDGVLEIAVLDEGPSEDPVTYFFQYDGTLSCIGSVSGFPFAEKNGGVNGFNGYGGIMGRSRTDLIETAYMWDHWWYDGMRISGLGLGWHDLLPASGHALYEDLPVCCEWEETSTMTMIPAQDEVFFLGTDGERWILVKGKDGSQGYMAVEDGIIVSLNKPAEEVFSGLHFFD
ncbi:MAG: YARHG domain-containing protein [Lachnospiraceae bacterium]|nr:YARHG domain-containing protein [Butyrivibrio sp.]MCM1342761.1 YARHG domain-containing protein [Muribaculaceae bacterium]MCM1409975.1 YARHG domain-containing protein [Lachnospiraceae bacterium]